MMVTPDGHQPPRSWSVPARASVAPSLSCCAESGVRRVAADLERRLRRPRVAPARAASPPSATAGWDATDRNCLRPAARRGGRAARARGPGRLDGRLDRDHPVPRGDARVLAAHHRRQPDVGHLHRGRGRTRHAAARRQHRPHHVGGRSGRHVRRDGLLGGQGRGRRAGEVAGPRVGTATGSGSTPSPRESRRRRCWRARAETRSCASIVEAVPMRRAGEPEEIAQAHRRSWPRTRPATSPDRPSASAAA